MSDVNAPGFNVSDPQAERPYRKAATTSDLNAPRLNESGLSDNAAGGLSYVTIIPAIAFLVIEPYKRSSFVRFHAWQSIFLGIGAFAISVIGVIPILGWIIFAVGMLVLFVAWIIAIIKAFGGERFKLPFIGDLAEKQAGA